MAYFGNGFKIYHWNLTLFRNFDSQHRIQNQFLAKLETFVAWRTTMKVLSRWANLHLSKCKIHTNSIKMRHGQFEKSRKPNDSLNSDILYNNWKFINLQWDSVIPDLTRVSVMHRSIFFPNWSSDNVLPPVTDAMFVNNYFLWFW